MNFNKALTRLRHGRRMRREAWAKDRYCLILGECLHLCSATEDWVRHSMLTDDILADDWEEYGTEDDEN